MTSPQACLLPASGDDRWALLRTLELVARSRLQFGQVAGAVAVIGHGVTLAPGPQVLQRIEIGCEGRQIGDLDMPIQAVEVVAHEVLLDPDIAKAFPTSEAAIENGKQPLTCKGYEDGQGHKTFIRASKHAARYNTRLRLGP